MKGKKTKFILWFKELNINDVSLVGGKNASLGEMYQNLFSDGINIPNGFAITAFAYRFFIKESGIEEKIKSILKNIDTKNIEKLKLLGKELRDMILNAEIPKVLEEEIIKAYLKLSAEYDKKNIDVAVRSSATAEDLPGASFAGQQESFLNIKGEQELILFCKKCFASLFTDRAISYRVDQGFDQTKVYLSIGVQKMVRSDLNSSGVMFTLDTESGFPDVVLINASYGLCESVVKGRVNPDEYLVFKPNLDKFRPIISKKIGTKKDKIIYNASDKNPTKTINVSDEERKVQCISDNDILTLARYAVKIEKHYQKPMDIEWAKDGIDKKLYIVQARPETVQSQKTQNKKIFFEEYAMLKKTKPLTSGASIGSKIGQGKANILKSAKEINNFSKGEVLVTEMTDPDWEPIMKIAKAIVTQSGGRTCHAAIVSRELGIPCIVGAKDATKKISNKMKITVDCSQGEEGYVYKGILPFKIKKINLTKIKKPKTKIMLNIGLTDAAFSSSFLPNDGVGLARIEFIISDSIKIHPMALINFSEISPKEQKQILEITFGYKNKKDFYIDKLAQGIAIIASAFFPKDVIVRFSDFKTNEYASLIGGSHFEPSESNPMIGWRGASRYYDKNFRPAFDLECLAIKKVREEMGLSNVKVMVPFCRTVEEGKKVISILSENGLVQGKNGLEVYVMCEIPSNVILADEFAKVFDGFSIGSNDLTQLTLGVDRDSSLVSHIYDERNKAVKILLSFVIKTAKKYNRKIGICGQAPSDFLDFAKFLVKEGIDSISLNPDTVIKTMLKLGK